MSIEALVWLLVGLGFGIAGTLMLLMAYSAMERFRLGRRLRQARTATAMAQLAARSMPPRPKGSRIDTVKTAPARSILQVTPAAEPEMPRPVVAEVPVVEMPVVEEPVPVAAPVVGLTPDLSEPAVIALPQPEDDVAVTQPEPVQEPVQEEAPEEPQADAAPPVERRVQSVEAMFAEAFANDRLMPPESGERSGKD